MKPVEPDDAGPIFEQPWQAQVLGVAFSLAQRGVFSRSEWSDALGAALKRAAHAGAPDTPETYYTCALQALEALLERTGEIPVDSLDARTAAWRRAYLATPHGQPVELASGEKR